MQFYDSSRGPQRRIAVIIFEILEIQVLIEYSRRLRPITVLSEDTFAALRSACAERQRCPPYPYICVMGFSGRFCCAQQLQP